MISIDADHTGLMCRADVACRSVFHPRRQDSHEDLAAAVTRRDYHEATAHQYVHTPLIQAPVWGYAAQMKVAGKFRRTR